MSSLGGPRGSFGLGSDREDVGTTDPSPCVAETLYDLLESTGHAGATEVSAMEPAGMVAVFRHPLSIGIGSSAGEGSGIFASYL
jgi:hypothetical protein